MLGRVNRIIMLDESKLNTEVAFPRIKKAPQSKDQNMYELPTVKEIFTLIESCKLSAISYAKEIKIIIGRTKEKLYLNCPINALQFKYDERHVYEPHHTMRKMQTSKMKKKI